MKGILKHSIIVADPHVPFQDQPLYKSIFKFCKELNLTSKDEFIINGDGIDFFAISPFHKTPTKQIDPDDVQYERDCLKKFLRDIRKVIGKAKIIYIMGNHENRWERYINGNAKALSKVPELEIKRFLGLNKYNIKLFEEYRPNPDFLCKHGDATNKYPSRAEVDKELISGCSGHAHRTDRAYKRGYDSFYRWYSLGHTADKSQIDKSCKFSKPLRWDQSFGHLITDLKSNKWDMEILHCSNGGFYSKHLRAYFFNRRKK